MASLGESASDSSFLDFSDVVMADVPETPLVTRLPADIYTLLFSAIARFHVPLPGVDIAARDAFDPTNEAGELAEQPWLIGRPGDLGWIKLGAVCRPWRLVLLEMPTLWAGDIGALPKGLDEMVLRAGDASPVTLRVYGSSFRGDPALVWSRLRSVHDTLRPRISAIHYAETRVNELLDNGFFTFIEEQPFPSLEVIEIFANETHWDADDARYEVPRFETPSLRRLALTNVTCLTSSTALTVLDLTVKEYPVNPSPWLIDAKHLREMFLFCCASLLELRLNIIFMHFDDSYDGHERIHFTALERIRYFDPVYFSSDQHPVVVLTWITFPASANITMELESSSNRAAYQAGLVLTALHDAGMPQPPVIALAKHSAAGRPNMMVLHFVFGRAGPDTEQYLSLTLYVLSAATLVTSVIKAVVQECDRAAVRILRVRDLSLADLVHPLAVFNPVQELVFDSDDLNPLVCVLSHRPDGRELILPRLFALTLRSTSMSRGPREYATLSVKELAKCLARRVGVTRLPIGKMVHFPETRITNLVVHDTVAVDAKEDSYIRFVNSDLSFLVGMVVWRAHEL